MSTVNIKLGNTVYSGVDTIKVPDADTAGQLDTFTNGMNMTLLWTNSSSTSSFAAQTISVPINGYNYLMILYDDRYTRYATMIMKNENDLRYMLSTTDVINYVASVAVRTVTLGSNSINFGNAQVKHHNSSSTTTDTTFLIPIRIYGFN